MMHSIVLSSNSFKMNSMQEQNIYVSAGIFRFVVNVNFWIKQQLFTKIVDYAIKRHNESDKGKKLRACA